MIYSFTVQIHFIHTRFYTENSHYNIHCSVVYKIFNGITYIQIKVINNLTIAK